MIVAQVSSSHNTVLSTVRVVGYPAQGTSRVNHSPLNAPERGVVFQLLDLIDSRSRMDEVLFPLLRGLCVSYHGHTNPLIHASFSARCLLMLPLSTDLTGEQHRNANEPQKSRLYIIHSRSRMDEGFCIFGLLLDSLSKTPPSTPCGGPSRCPSSDVLGSRRVFTVPYHWTPVLGGSPFHHRHGHGHEPRPSGVSRDLPLKHGLQNCFLTLSIRNRE